MTWTAIGVLVTGAGLIITIALFAVESARARRAAAEASRRELLGRVIDTVERAARAQTRFPFGHVRGRNEFEFALALPRLLVALSKQERPIAIWVAKKIQLMSAMPKVKDTTRVAFEIAFRLTDWHTGDTKLKWFEDQLELDPYDVSFRVPARVTFQRQARFSLEVAKVTVVGVGTLLSIRSIIRLWES